MAKEIERKFLVKDDSYLDAAYTSIEMEQGYISTDPDATVRIRIAGDEAFLTVKSRNRGAVRHEWEFAVDAAEAREMLEEVSAHVLAKTRYLVREEGGLVWEVDCFHGRLDGLVIAEIELPSEDTPFERPDFIGDEITGDPRYYNSNLAAQA